MILKYAFKNNSLKLDCYRVLKSQIQKNIVTTSNGPPRSLGGDMTMYKSFLDDLKKKPVQKFARVSDKSYNEIDSQFWNDIPSNLKKEVPWSSEYDPATRSPFAKDVLHLQSLLDALLSGKNFERADKIVHAIYPLLSNEQDFIFSINKYLESWGSNESVTLQELQDYISLIFTRYRGVRQNARTYSIVLAKYIQTHTPFESFLEEYSNPFLMKQILANIDVLGVDSLIQIFKSNYKLDIAHVPHDLIELFKQVRNESEPSDKLEEYFENDKHDAPIIDNDMSSLKSVDSFGLKVIRHTLLGLKTQTGSLEFEKMMKDIEKEQGINLLYNNVDKRRNFFEIYKLLTTEEQKQKFSEALDIFNEARQRQLELRGIDGAREKWKHEFDSIQNRGGIRMGKGLNAQMFQWYVDLLPYVEEESKICKKLIEGDSSIHENLTPTEIKQMKEREHYAPYLVLVEPKKMCVLTILELLKLNSTGGVVDGMRTARALVSVGKAIELEYRAQSLVKTHNKSLSKKLKTSLELRKLLRRKNTKEHDNNSTLDDWSPFVHVKLGSVLISLLIHVAKVPVSAYDPTTQQNITGFQPAFHHTYQYLNGQKLGVLKIHREIIRKLAGKNSYNAVQPQLLPMLTPPREWTTHRDGGFLFSQNSLVRIKDSAETQAYLRAASDLETLDDVYTGLNVLGRTAWTVNKQVFQVITHFWNTGEQVLGIPPVMEDDIDLPPPLPQDAEPLEKLERMRKIRQIVNDKASNRSQRCDTNYKLEIARAFVGEKLFFPHNVDFRGRAYPLSPHFNHLGNDLTRSLFLFWEGKEIGERGLEWLKIHLANVYGIDKAPLHERVQFVNDNMDEISKSAKDPYSKDAWWTKGDKPWQVLSVCFELSEAYKLDDPTKYVSHLPVHQDGTCNGLQHYAALGGDVEGAKQVNLLPADRPQDVYSHVAALVEERVKEDAAQGNLYAIFAQGKITRKVVKQTVMTNVYGVTFVGGVAQIRKQIEHHFDKHADTQEYARYLTTKVFASIRELFEGAHLIQDWLGESAKRISKSVRIDYEEVLTRNSTKPNHLSSVIWTTPLGLPCVQPYRVTKSTLIRTNLQDVSIGDPFGATQIDSRKQQAAFPPNFVHSLDATHMLMTAKACGQKNLSFAAVHDSYWTHACDVDYMNQQIREQFVNLHKNDLIKQLKEEFEKRYKGFLQVTMISSDHEVAKKVKEVRQKISKNLGRPLTVADEVYLEKKRQQLLDSNDPKIIQVGKEMVTTVSVTEGYDMNELSVKPGSSRAIQVLIPLKFPDVPKRGDFDVDLVKDSVYFFS
jgi:DNA-directed RNA polymerase